MIKKSHIYWYCQIIGWSFFIFLSLVFYGLSSSSGLRDFLLYFLMLPTGIGISHAYRLLLIRFRILELKIPSQLFYIIVFSFLKALVFFVVSLVLLHLLGLQVRELSMVVASEQVLNFSGIFILWNVIYFGFHYFQNYKRSEINALRYLAASRESELNNLKAQLNPHFIFNCMNSIRALIDEDPIRAKSAVTQLSNILRNTLLIEKNKEIFLRDEMNLVSDYLNLEKIRYEERLNYEFRIDEDVKSIMIPPFIIQAQVENAIKHGISRLPGQGIVLVEASRNGGTLRIRVSNTGRLSTLEPLTGVGFKNSVHRLGLLYGGQAGIDIAEESDLVVVNINIPLK